MFDWTEYRMETENKVMHILKTHEIRRLLYSTPLGNLELKRTKGEARYVFTLDAVPVDKETQSELEKLFNINR